MRKVTENRKQEAIEVTRESQINEEIVLEPGDKVRVVKENVRELNTMRIDAIRIFPPLSSTEPVTEYNVADHLELDIDITPESVIILDRGRIIDNFAYGPFSTSVVEDRIQKRVDITPNSNFEYPTISVIQWKDKKYRWDSI